MKIFEKVGMCAWLVDNKIVGWKIQNKFIQHPLSYNTRNWHPFEIYHDFKKLNLYVPWFLYNFTFRIIAKIYFKQWKYHEKFKGLRTYY